MGVCPAYPVKSLYYLLYCRFSPIACERERLKESLPKDGEMRQPDVWYQTPPRYFNQDSPAQGPFSFSSVPSGPQCFPFRMEPCYQQESSLYAPAKTSSYPTVVHDFSLPPTQTDTGKTSTGPINFSLGSADPSLGQ
jgi:hypothetical protein